LIPKRITYLRHPPHTTMTKGLSFHVTSPYAAYSATPTPAPVEDEEFYSSWSLFLVCMLLILSLWTSYYLQIKRIRAIHETLVSVFAGMFVGLVVRLAPGTMIREMLVSSLPSFQGANNRHMTHTDLQTYPIFQPTTSPYHPQFWIRTQAGKSSPSKIAAPQPNTHIRKTSFATLGLSLPSRLREHSSPRSALGEFS
jgi:hypothetical protein